MWWTVFLCSNCLLKLSERVSPKSRYPCSWDSHSLILRLRVHILLHRLHFPKPALLSGYGVFLREKDTSTPRPAPPCLRARKRPSCLRTGTWESIYCLGFPTVDSCFYVVGSPLSCAAVVIRPLRGPQWNSTLGSCMAYFVSLYSLAQPWFPEQTSGLR